MEVYQGRVTCKIVVSGINTKVGVSNGGTRHVQRVNDLLKVGGRMVRGDVVSENDEELDGKKSKTQCIFNQKGIKSHDKQSDHMTINKRSETDLRTIIKQLIGN